MEEQTMKLKLSAEDEASKRLLEAMMDEKVITMRPGTFRLIMIAMVLGALAIWGMSLHIFGGMNYRKGSADGRHAQAIVNPSQAYIESGRAFCWSEGNWYDVRPGKGGFKIAK